MQTRTLNQAAEIPAALVAFLKGAERRAFLFLWLQGGDEARADRALAAAIRAFRTQAERLPMAEWPAAFWRLLVALPETTAGRWPEGLAALAGMAPAPRRALLLRLAGGLQEDEAATILSVEVPAYEQALAAACPRDAGGRPDAVAWRRLAEGVHQAGRDLPPARLARLAALREQELAAAPAGSPPDSLAPTATKTPTRETDARPARRPRRRWPWILLVVLLCAVALVATRDRSWPVGLATQDEVADPDDVRVRDRGPILVEPLPAYSGPAPEPMLPAAMPEPPADPVIARMDLLSWYAAGAPASRLEREETPVEAAADTPIPPAPALDVGGTGLDAAWAALDAVEQARLRESAVAFDALDGDSQLALQSRFVALDRMERAGWRLGPALGADYPALQPLLGYVPEQERDAVLLAVRQLGPEQRAQLAVLSQRTPGHARDALRRELLAQAPPQRAAWLAQRLR